QSFLSRLMRCQRYNGAGSRHGEHSSESFMESTPRRLGDATALLAALRARCCCRFGTVNLGETVFEPLVLGEHFRRQRESDVLEVLPNLIMRDAPLIGLVSRGEPFAGIERRQVRRRFDRCLLAGFDVDFTSRSGGL